MVKQLFPNQNLKTIKYIVKGIQWDSLIRAPWWFLSIHTPFIITCLIQATYKPYSKNLYFNSRVYDGLTRNGFINGNLIIFLYKIGAIKKSLNHEDDDGRGYFIDNIDDDDD